MLDIAWEVSTKSIVTFFYELLSMDTEVLADTEGLTFINVSDRRERERERERERLKEREIDTERQTDRQTDKRVCAVSMLWWWWWWCVYLLKVTVIQWL